jgi:UDP-glucuronate decarboxylase
MLCKNCNQEITYTRDHWSHMLEVMGENGNYEETTHCGSAEAPSKGIIQEDIENVIATNRHLMHKFDGEGVLITGGAGFLGSYFVDLLAQWNETEAITPCQIYCLDTFITGTPKRLAHLEGKEYFHPIARSVVDPLPYLKVNYILHFASIASPIFYRQHPIETIDANVSGVRNLLEYAATNKIKSMLSMSTSETYGSPPSEMIPTSEDYHGNVSFTGPRACYDESKRLGETLCVNFFREKGVPVKIARPFNVYGPGLRMDDKRIIPDLFSGAFFKKEIIMYSDGTPTRSFCYVSDALDAFVKILLSDYNGEPFNVGNDREEISMRQLAEEVIRLFDGVKLTFSKSNDKDYLTDNPQRRCPDLSKIKRLTGYQPKVALRDGLARLKRWYEEEKSR